MRVSVLIEVLGRTIVIDSGPDFRYQMLRAGVKDLDAILFTHEHKDHVAGLDDIRPFNYQLGKTIDVYASERVQLALKREFSYIFSDTQYHGLPKIHLHNISADPFDIDGVIATPIEIMHYKLPILGFRIEDFTYITDAKYIPEDSVNKIKGSKILVLNALQKESHVSHLTLHEAVEFAQMIGAERTFFTHMSHNLGLHRNIETELPKGIHLAYDGLVLESN